MKACAIPIDRGFMNWPPDFNAELRRRADLELGIARDPKLLLGALVRYAESVTAFASDCAWLHEPRNANTGESVHIPVVLFKRQEEFLLWLQERYTTRIAYAVSLLSVRILARLRPTMHQ